MVGIGERAIEMLRQNMVEAGINASGKTSKSFDFDETPTRFTLFSDGSGAPVSTLQHGRPAGRVPSNFVGIIAQWIIDKGISVKPIPYKRKPSENWQPKYTPEERGLQSMAGAIAYKIKEEGTERHRRPRDDIYTPVQDFVISECEKKFAQMVIDKLE